MLTDPTLHDVSFPDELQEGGVVGQESLAPICGAVQLLHFLQQCLAALGDLVSIVVTLADQFVTVTGDVCTAAAVDLAIGLKGIVLLQQALEKNKTRHWSNFLDFFFYI